MRCPPWGHHPDILSQPQAPNYAQNMNEMGGGHGHGRSQERAVAPSPIPPLTLKAEKGHQSPASREGAGRASIWRREEAKNRKSGEEMAEEGLIALAPESDCLVLSLACSVFLLKLQFPS